MKSIFKFGAVAALTLFAASCAKEQIVSENETVETSFAVELPGGATKALGDGMTATQLYYQVFDKDGNAIEGLGVQTKTLQAGKASVSFNLVKGQEYKFVFWAQTPVAGYYTIDEADGLKKISANYADKAANDENFDAFYAVEKLTVNAGTAKEVSLTRPFAQVNIATVGKLTAGSASRDINFDGAVSSVSFKNIPTAFAPLADDDVVDGTETVTFDSAAVPEGNITVAGNDYKYLSLNYIFAPKGGSVYDINAEFVVEGKTVPLEVNAAPVKRNYRTNIVGNLLLASGQFDVVVDPDFGGDEVVAYDEAALRAAVAKGGTVVVSNDITVNQTMSLPTGTNLNLVVAEGATLTGKDTEKLISLFNSGINCTLSGDGRILGPKVTGKSLVSVVNVEDASNNLVIDGNITIEACNGTTYNNGNVNQPQVDACVVVRWGKVTINGGHFIASKDFSGNPNPAVYLYSPNSFRSEVIINGGVFESVCGNCKFLINKDDDNEDHETVLIYGGTFIGWDPADNEADGPHTNYVAEGYHSTVVATDENGVNTYMVSKKGTVPVLNQQGLNTALAEENATVLVPKGVFNLPSSVADGVTIEGVEGTVIDIPAAVQYHNKNVTFKNTTLKSPNANYTGIQHAASVKYVDCVIEGQPFSYATDAVFENCTFNQTSNDAYNIWTYGSKNITFNDCVFNCAGKSVLIYSEDKTLAQKATFNNCEFVASEAVVEKAAIEIDQTFSSYEVYINNCTTKGFSLGSESGNYLWNNKRGVASDTNKINSLKVFVDGVQVL